MMLPMVFASRGIDKTSHDSSYIVIFQRNYTLAAQRDFIFSFRVTIVVDSFVWLFGSFSGILRYNHT